MGTTIKIHRGDDSGAFGGHLFSITDTESLYDIKTVEIGFGVVKLRYNKPDEGDLFPIVVDLDVVQTNVNGVGDYPISVTAYDSNDRRLLIDQSCTLSVVPNSESIPTPYELTVLFDIADVMPTSSDEPEPYDPGESPRRGKIYYNTGNDRLLVFNGITYDEIAYSDDAPSAHTHAGSEITSKVSSAETADYLGSSSIGSSSNPIYLNNGVPTACTLTTSVVTELPSTPDSNTIYIVVEEDEPVLLNMSRGMNLQENSSEPIEESEIEEVEPLSEEEPATEEEPETIEPVEQQEDER